MCGLRVSVVVVAAVITLATGMANSLPGTAAPPHPKLILPPSPFFRQATDFLPNKKVFAHYMVCCGAFFKDKNLTLEEAARQDILMAQAMGIDGFALNGGWSPPYPAYTRALFQAAADLGTGFELFFSADMCCGLSSADIVNMMMTYAGHPNYMVKDGRPVLSAYDGGRGANVSFWRDQVLAPLADAGYNVYFIPHVFPDPLIDPATTEAIEATVSYWSGEVRAGSSAGLVDGMFNFNTAQLSYGEVPNLVQNTKDYAAALSKAGKSFMASFSPYYWGAYQSNSGRRYFNERGGQGMNEQFKAIQEANPDWMQILTWNDWAESYMMPIDDFTNYSPCLLTPKGNCVPAGWYQDHRGMAELARYYIQWFKTGIEPTITKDALFYFYVTQTSDATITSADPFGRVGRYCRIGICIRRGVFGDSTDNVYIAAAMTAAGSITWDSGNLHQSQAVPAGLSFVSGPSAPGAQTFSLSRAGIRINSVHGPDIRSALPLYDYWPATGYVEGPN
ncbi:MAG: hypothetical protein JO270_12225 [Acidobacteriaceae bacterium]|nr:hypothetical protein [Acidobacteriaceae bacterium]